MRHDARRKVRRRTLGYHIGGINIAMDRAGYFLMKLHLTAHQGIRRLIGGEQLNDYFIGLDRAKKGMHFKMPSLVDGAGLKIPKMDFVPVAA